MPARDMLFVPVHEYKTTGFTIRAGNLHLNARDFYIKEITTTNTLNRSQWITRTCHDGRRTHSSMNNYYIMANTNKTSNIRRYYAHKQGRISYNQNNKCTRLEQKKK